MDLWKYLSSGHRDHFGHADFYVIYHLFKILLFFIFFLNFVVSAFLVLKLFTVAQYGLLISSNRYT